MTEGMSHMPEQAAGAQWASWISCRASQLKSRIQTDLNAYSLSDDMKQVIVEFVREYRRGGRGWSERGMRGDEVIAPMLGVRDTAPELFELVRTKIAQAEKDKWMGGSLDSNVMAAQLQYRRFAIVSTPRSGTHLLRTLLGSHPCIEVHGEAFNRFGQHLLPYSVQDTTAAGVLERHLFRPYFEYVEAVGFVLFRDLDTHWGSQNVWSALADVRDLKIILLDRRNRLERLVSLKKSLCDHVWYVGREDKRLSPHVELSVPLHELVDFIDRDLANRAQFCDQFHGHDILPITYEELLATPEVVHARMLKFLGVSAAMLQSGTGKKEKAPVSAVVNNIDQLKSELSGTKYESYI